MNYLLKPRPICTCNLQRGDYKHHNTDKFLIGCALNGISYISQLYVGSISDEELTYKCGFIDTLVGKIGSSVMADRGFTIRDILNDIGVD